MKTYTFHNLEWSDQSMQLIPCLHLVRTLRMCDAVPPIPSPTCLHGALNGKNVTFPLWTFKLVSPVYLKVRKGHNVITFHTENPKRCHSVIKFYFIFIWNKILLHCGILLDFLYELHYDAQIHKHEVITFVSAFKNKYINIISPSAHVDN
jgi:hypothetical protein